MNDEDWDDPEFNWVKAMPNTLDIQFHWIQEELWRMAGRRFNQETWDAAIAQREELLQKFVQCSLLENWLANSDHPLLS